MTAGPELDRQHLAAARLWAANSHPYLASALFASPVVAKAGVGANGKGGVAVDPYWRLYIDPSVVSEWSVEQLGSELIHHTGHLLREHAARAKAMGFDDPEIGAWVDAADAEINDDLPSDLLRPVDSMMPSDLGCEDGRFAEEYFHEGEHSGHHHRDCGSGAHGQRSDWDDSPPEGDDEGVHEDQAELLRRKVANDVIEHAREHGDLPAGLLRWAEDLVKPTVDWRRVLGAELRRGLSEAAGAVDYSHQRPSRRASVMGDVVLPSLRQPVPQIAVVVDTSASMNEDLLAMATAEIDGVLGSAGVRPDCVRVLSCDTEVGPAQRVRSSSQVQLVGGGGTDMVAGIDAATGLRPTPQVVIVLTDGFTPWPPAPPPRSRVVVAMIGSGSPTPPGWAAVVHVGDEA